jgi:myosin heavy subunit
MEKLNVVQDSKQRMSVQMRLDNIPLPTERLIPQIARHVKQIKKNQTEIMSKAIEFRKQANQMLTLSEKFNELNRLRSLENEKYQIQLHEAATKEQTLVFELKKLDEDWTKRYHILEEKFYLNNELDSMGNDVDKIDELTKSLAELRNSFVLSEGANDSQVEIRTREPVSAELQLKRLQSENDRLKKMLAEQTGSESPRAKAEKSASRLQHDKHALEQKLADNTSRLNDTHDRVNELEHELRLRKSALDPKEGRLQDRLVAQALQIRKLEDRLEGAHKQLEVAAEAYLALESEKLEPKDNADKKLENEQVAELTQNLENALNEKTDLENEKIVVDQTNNKLLSLVSEQEKELKAKDDLIAKLLESLGTNEKEKIGLQNMTRRLSDVIAQHEDIQTIDFDSSLHETANKHANDCFVYFNLMETRIEEMIDKMKILHSGIENLSE